MLPTNWHFAVSGIGHKGDISKSMKNALYILQYAKRHLLDWSKKKAASLYVILVIVELQLSEGIS